MTTNIIFITVDPQRDTQEYLKDYMSNFNENVIGITGEIMDIKKQVIYLKQNFLYWISFHILHGIASILLVIC